MLYLADSEKMKAIDSYSINTIGIPSMVLMERAALATALKIREALEGKLPDTGRPLGAEAKGATEGWPQVIAVCGSGNNGGDGLAVVRILHTMGYRASWYMAGDMDRATPQTKQQLEILERMGLKPCRWPEDLAGAQIVADAIFGIGLAREVSGHYARVIRQINESPAMVCAVDIPSGVSADTGQVLGCAVRADFTVTFGNYKQGLALYPGAGLAGRVYVENIGFAPEAEAMADIRTFACERSDIPSLLPARRAWSNKGSYGRVLVIAGSPSMGGACCFCARAALCSGSGLVRVFTVKENHDVILGMIPEAVLTIYDPAQPHRTRRQLMEALAWADSVVLGPGLSTEDWACRLVRDTLENCRVPLLIDADGLNVLARDQGLWELVPENTVLTPHMGEMSRLTGRPVEQLTGDPVGVCRDFASRHQVICVLKDARTVISDGDRAWINLSGNDGMATGGSGDVLSGIIGSFSGGGLKPLTAAFLGCFVHGCAGDEARRVKGSYGLLASDIIQYLSNVLR